MLPLRADQLQPGKPTCVERGLHGRDSQQCVVGVRRQQGLLVRAEVPVAMLAAVLNYRQCDNGMCCDDLHVRKVCGNYQPCATSNTKHPLT